MIAITTAPRIDGYQIVAYKGTAQGVTFDELLKSAEALGANAVLNTCYDDAVDVDTLFHGAAVVIAPIQNLSLHLLTVEGRILSSALRCEPNGRTELGGDLCNR